MPGWKFRFVIAIENFNAVYRIIQNANSLFIPMKFVTLVI